MAIPSQGEWKCTDLIKYRSVIFDIYMYMNIALRRFLHNHGNITTEESPRPRLCPTLISTSRVLYSAQYHRQHCTLHAFEQFGALHMHSQDDKYPSRPGFEPGTPSYKPQSIRMIHRGRPISDIKATLISS